MQTTTKTRRAIQIEHIAAVIAECWDPRDDDSPASYAACVNNGDGWTIDVRYGHEGPDNWTRTEGIRLDDAELADAVHLAGELG